MDTTNGTWTRAVNTGSTATTLTATAAPAALQGGIHILYFFATDGSDATSINPLLADPGPGKDSISIEAFAPATSSIIGGLNAYLFLVNAAAVPNVSISGRVTTPNGQALRNAIVTLTDANNVRRTATTSSFGNYGFTDVRGGETYFLAVASKRFRFASRTVTVLSSDLTAVDFIGLE